VLSRLQLYRHDLQHLGPRESAVYIAGKLRGLLRGLRRPGAIEGLRGEMNLMKFEMTQMKVLNANIAALRRFQRQPIARPVNVIGIYETPRRAQLRAGLDWGTGSAARVVRHTVAGIDSGDMLKGENARVLAGCVAEHLRGAFETE